MNDDGAPGQTEHEMTGMTRSQAEAFRHRWQAVAATEAEEHRSASLQPRWKQLNALRCLAGGLDLAVGSVDEQEKSVWKRWARLKDLAERSRPPS